jgi:hypothetical protein
MLEKRQFTFQRTIQVSFSGKFPPDARALSGLGFDSVSSTRQSITIRKSQRGILSLPLAHLEIAIRHDSAQLKLSAPASCDPHIQELRAVATFLRVLSLFPTCRADTSELAQLILPSLDAAAAMADAPYEALSKKCRDAHDSLSVLLAKNRALLRSSEEGVLASLELERQSSALSARIKKLESISEDALLELVQEWVSSHHGKFNAALFAKSYSIPPARAEEGLELLLAYGAIRKVGGSLHVQSAHSHGIFESKPTGALESLRNALGGAKIRKMP